MSTDTVPLFINPTAGRGRAGRRLSRITAIFEQAGVRIDVHTSRWVGDLEDQVRTAASSGQHRIIVAGGDGSVHEAVNGIMNSGGSAALGTIPTGTGNDFAKACAIPLDWQHATQLLADRLHADNAARRIDIGRMNGRFFANGAGIGLDAKVTRVARDYRWPIGDFVYLLAILRCLLDGIETPELNITFDDAEWHGPATLVNVSNGPWIGGMFHIAPMADNADGRFEMIVVDPVSRLRIVSLLPLLMRGEHVNAMEISHMGAERLSVHASVPMPSHLDGEVQAPQSEFEIEILPRALGLL